MGLTAVFGGTFNPPHIGHYAILAALDARKELDSVFVLPDRIPPHKECDILASDEARIEMCRLMCRSFKKAELCLIEFEREGKSYSYDTVMQLKACFPEREFTFVCGGDMILSFEAWYKYRQLLSEVSLTAFYREGIDRRGFDEAVARLRRTGSVTVLESSIPEVSSSEIRKTGGKSLLAPEIYEYITEKGLYHGN